ncbi:MAG: ThuA domain-containing protein [Pirellulaceae bacterium]
MANFFSGRVPALRTAGLPLVAHTVGLLWLIATATALCQEDSTDKPGNKLLLLGQAPDDHPAATHEYMAGVRLLARLFRTWPDIQVDTASADGNWDEGPALVRRCDTAVLFLSEGARWIHDEPRRLEAFAQLAARGGGLVAIHWGMGTREPQYIDGFLKLFGGCHGGPDRKYKVLETNVEIADPTHPIVGGLRPLGLREEFYYQLKFAQDLAVKPVLKAEIDGNWETVAWAWERNDGGRSFGFSGCHYHENWRHTEYRRLLVNAILWTLKRPIPAGGALVDISDTALQLRSPGK